MRSTARSLAVLTLGWLVLATGGGPDLTAQAPPKIETASDEAGLTISCEVFCSDTRIRTGSARIRWRLTKGGPEAARLASATPSLQATVFYQGFEKDLYVTLPAAGGRATPAAAQARQARPLRAFEIQIAATERPRSEAGTPEAGVVVENLEPGANYSWRVAVDTAGGRLVSPVVTCEAPVCPFDEAAEPPPPVRRPPGVLR
jgi:hypothetical protein